MTNTAYPKRLIEVDLPIRRISAHARREKSIRPGHLSTLHIWWARRPLAACRAVILAALWPDPADPLCPTRFRDAASKALEGTLGGQTTVNVPKRDYADPENVRAGLLDFISEFANWDRSTDKDYLAFARHLVQVAHESLGGEPGTRPLVVDPFAGGGSIPLEAIRVGADAFASDLNPVAVLLNKIALEYIPRYGRGLADEVRKWGAWVKEQAEKELAAFYPKDPDGATPVAYLWARTIVSEAPDQGDIPVEIPLIRSMWLAKKDRRWRALRWVRDAHGAVRTETVEVPAAGGGTRQLRRPMIELFEPKMEGDVEEGTEKRKSATCPVTNFTTPANSVRSQLQRRHGGASDARLLCVATTRPGQKGRYYRLPTPVDLSTYRNAGRELQQLLQTDAEGWRQVYDSPTPEGAGSGAGRAFSQRLYGMDTLKDVYNNRQLLAMSVLSRVITEAGVRCGSNEIGALLGCALSRVNDLAMSLCCWKVTKEFIGAANGGQNKMPVPLDYAEANPLGSAGGDWLGQVDWVARVIEHISKSLDWPGRIARSPAQDQVLPDDSADAIVTDPPYYDAFPYSDLSEFFFPWVRKTLGVEVVDYEPVGVPKDREIVVYDAIHGTDGLIKDSDYFSRETGTAFQAMRVVAKPPSIGVVVFANKETQAWESLVSGIVSAGWVITASWPIATERPVRQRALGSAALASSVHLVCRPRENPDGSLRTDDIGDWRDVLHELPRRIHEWLPRLADEGVVGADAIFACLGPALEVFSRYSRVEKASGEVVTLRAYLEQVWAAVAKEALALLFHEADASGLEADARLTAMWLWTLSTGRNGKPADESAADDAEAEGDTDDEDDAPARPAKGGFSLEYDAARKIAQGLGAHLEALASLVEVKGQMARLLPVGERAKYLFGKDAGRPAPAPKKPRRRAGFLKGMEDVQSADPATMPAGELGPPKLGATVLDRVHQAMLLFGSGRSEALRRFVVEEGAGADAGFWKLAQSLSALYPAGTDEKRWVDGVLARKKGLGF
jgi:adenine-specific DNA methylase